MERPLNRKRQREDDLSQDHLPSKKVKVNGLSHRLSNFSPDFYDNLSKIHLTTRALRELDRRNDQHPRPTPSASRESITDFSQVIRKGGPQLARFARGGGPNLFDLRGYQGSITITHPMASASSSRTSRWTQSTRATTVSSRSRRSAYDPNFEQNLIDHTIYPPFHLLPNGRRNPKPANIEEIRDVLRVPRGSLSPSVVPESAFEDFQLKNTTKSEGTLMRNVVPILAGGDDIPNEGHLPFVNLDSMTKNTTAHPVPDFFDGAQPGDVDKQVREDLYNIIIPTKHPNVPVAPNFFLEAKGPGGSGEVVKVQAVLNGAYGARMMHALQNYGEEEPEYDGYARTFTATFLDGTLKLYAHHVTAPTSPGQRPEFHTTLLDAYALTGNDKGWLEGTGAFRNLRKLAKDYRDRFIANANARARNRSADATATEEVDNASTIEEHRERSSSPLEFFDCQLFAEPKENEQDTQEVQDTSTGLGILHHTQNEDDKDPDFSQPDAEASTGFATSLTSSCLTQTGQADQMGSQQQLRPAHSPPSPSSTRLSKKRGPAEG
ncbi:hypothetical protein BX600DRAFT_150096 [Xylariales sp. PMI_506]|nr:hypothetical protein BX600DRAFT_150096 [Xylariales sp. PMI_506]